MKFKLSNGKEIPAIAIGTWSLEGDEAYNSVLNAIKNGYTHIDAAAVYGNEVEVGRAIKDSGVDRSKLFITSKLWNAEQGYESAKKALEKSLKDLGLDYLDMYLIHWPKTYELARESWKAMEEAFNDGKVKGIGVSNFNIHHIEDILKVAKVKPIINQVECHLELQNVKLREYCESHGIQLEAYAPLMSHAHVKNLLSRDDLKAIADKYNATPAQIALKYLIQRNIVVLARSSKEERIIENLKCLDITIKEEDMKTLRNFNSGNRTFPEPDNIDF